MRSIAYPLSNLEWTTHSGSYGSFNIESCLSLFDNQKTEVKNFYLASSVLAGNMYVKSNLLKKPAYHFQLMLTDDYHRILRRSVHLNVDADRGRVIKDSINDNSYFGSIASNIVFSRYQIVTTEMELMKSIRSGYKLRNIRINIDLDKGLAISLESPVKHYNYMKETGNWQIETGPVLFLPSGSKNFNSSREALEQLSPAFIHTNSFSKAYCTTDYPFHINEDPIRLDCRIELLVSID